MKAGAHLPGAKILEAIAGADVLAGTIVRLSGLRVYPAHGHEWVGVAAHDAREDETVLVVYAGVVAVRAASWGELGESPRWAHGEIVRWGPRLRTALFVDVACEPGTVAICLPAPVANDPRWRAMAHTAAEKLGASAAEKLGA